MTWQTRKLGDILELRYGKSLPARKRTSGEVPVYGSGGIDGHNELALIKGPGVIVGRKGSVGSVFFEARDFFPIDTVYYVWPKHDAIDVRFAYYLLKNLPLASLNTDAAVPGLNRERALSIAVRLPDQSGQETILSILSAYDDLIQNNRRRITLLEEAARILYREWFVRLRFPGHEHVKIIDGLPEGWGWKSFGDVAELRYGKALKEENRIEGLFPVYGSSGIVGTHEAALIEGPSIIVGRKGNVGSLFWSPVDFWPIDTVYFIPKEQSDFWLYLALPSAGFQSTDAGVPGLNRDFAYSRKLVQPSVRIRRQFNEAVEPMFRQCATMETFNRKLAQARDLLLPALMSGEVTV